MELTQKTSPGEIRGFFLSLARFRKILLIPIDTICRYLYYHTTAARGCGENTTKKE